MALLFCAFLSVILFLDCVVLIFLILLQLPKKEAGAGMAFGGAATDALFGAGSGNALTTITKYSAGIFFGVALLMAIITTHLTPTGGGAFEEALTKSSAVGPARCRARHRHQHRIDLLAALGAPAPPTQPPRPRASNSAVPAAPARRASATPASRRAPAPTPNRPRTSNLSCARLRALGLSRQPRPDFRNREELESCNLNAPFGSAAACRRFHWRNSAWAALSLCLLAACSVSEPKAGLVVINGPDPQTLDPALATSLEDLRVINGLFEGLTRYDPVTARPIPGLAEKWEISADGRVYTLSPARPTLLVPGPAHHRG